jgi:hypothetical protein
MRKLALFAVGGLLIFATAGASADTFAVTLVSQTSNTITLGWTPQPGYGYLFSANGQLVSRTNDASRSTVRFTKANTYDIDVLVKGANGHYPTTPPPTADTTPPTVSMTAPANATTVSGNINVSASATDNVAVTRVDFFRDGNQLASDSTSPFGISFDTATVANGAHTFGARAYDAAGNVGLAPQVSVTVNNVAPPSVAACSDGIDNDNDALIDYPNDPGCTSASDTDETNVVPPPSGGSLLWAPPALSNPTTINVTNSSHSFSLNNSQDYIVKMPSTPLTVTGGLELIGGHNIVIVGGEINRPTAVNDVAGSYGISLYRQTGTVHLEGLWIHGVGIGQAVLIAHTDQTSANSVIQIENSRMESLHTVGTIHTDTIQSYGGPAQLRLYQNTMISNGVVIQTQPCDVGNGPAPHNWDYRKLDLIQQTPDAYGLWKNCTAWSEYHEDIWYHFDPNGVAAGSNQAWAEGNCWPCWNPGGTWPITGETMHLGYRPGGQVVPQGAVGIGYVSPGYQ